MLTEPEKMKDWSLDWTQGYEASARAVVFPKDKQQVSKLLKFCNQNNISVVPSGGRTGLAAAAVANNGEIVLSLSRLNKILEVDLLGMSVRCQAGVITQDLQERASEEGVFLQLI